MPETSTVPSRPAVEREREGAAAAEDEVDVPGLEVQLQPGIRAGGGRLGADRPGPRQAVLADRDGAGEGVGGRRALLDRGGPGEVLQPVVAEVGLGAHELGRGEVGDVGRRRQLHPRVGVDEEPADGGLRLTVLALPEALVAHLARRVDEVVRRPVLVAVGVPRVIAVVDGDRVGDAELLHRAFDVGGHVLEGKLRRVHSDDLQTVGTVTLVPGLDVGEAPLAVDAGIGPEVDQDNLATQRPDGERRPAGCVQPGGDALEVGGREAVVAGWRSRCSSSVRRSRPR